MILLNKEQILRGIYDEQLRSQVNLHVLNTIDSTNSFLKSLNTHDYITICSAEQQTNGRGRLGRTWHSPSGENIYLSLRWFTNEPIDRFATLSLVIAISIVEVLKKLDICNNIAIKWPNDIYYKDKKLAGILTEITHHPDNYISIVAGLGININSNFENTNWTSLLNITNKKYDRNIIISELITQIQNDLNRLITSGFDDFLQLWQQYDYLYNKNISVTYFNNIIQGIAAGINSLGELRILDKDKKEIYLKSGEATLSPTRLK